MIMYVLFILMEFLGISIFFYALMSEYQFYLTIATTLHLQYVVIPLGFYLMIAAGMFFIATPIAILMRIKSSGSGKRFDSTPHNKGLFDFIYRDGEIRDVYGDRIPGLGLFRIFKLGLIFDTGREPKPGSVYNIPGKKIRFALQDINFTPNSKFAGFYTYLNNLGFNNMTEVNDVLNGYNPELMVRVWNTMCNAELRHPEDVLVERMQDLDRKDIVKINKLWRQETRRKRRVKKEKQAPSGKEPVSPFGIINKALNETQKPRDDAKGVEDEIDRRLK